MFIGHIGFGLALKKAEPHRNLAWLIGAAIAADLILWILVLAGVENVYVPENYSQIHYLTFFFPYSHSLLGSLILTGLFFRIGVLLQDRRTGLLFAAAAFSHFVGDVIEHIPEIPLFDNVTPKLGLGLWEHMPVALGLEVAIVIVGLFLYLKSTRPIRRFGGVGMIALMVMLTIAAVFGQLYAPKPPSIKALASNSLITLTIILILVYLLDKRRVYASAQT
jgi:hypothetical protein